MKKVVLIALALCMGFVTVNAQITTGENSAQVIRTGNRAEAGDFGLYLGASSSIFKNLMNVTDASVEALPLINFKYMMNDNLEARIGLEWWTVSGIGKTSGEDKGGDFETKSKAKESRKYLTPGIAYHFNSTNLLDVYVGAELPFGWGGTTTINYADLNGKDFDVDDKTKENAFKIGLGAFVGLQAYIANLPLAIGVEYGISSMKDISSSTTVTDEKQEYKTKGSNADWKVGNQARLTLTYFFKL